jgi:hypothetical protein
MIKDELIPIIRTKFQEGKRRDDIKEDLITQGYDEEDIDAAIAEIQHDAIKQLPGISSIYRVVENFEKKSNMTTARMTALVMAVCIGILVLLAVALYFIFDPLGTQSNARDAERKSDMAKIQTALGFYYQQNHKYPSDLNSLVPTFLSSLPLDPQSGGGYSYKLLDSSNNYQLCISYELQSQECVNASAATSSIPSIPTATPVPDFVPQSNSDASSAGSVQVSPQSSGGDNY